MDGLDGDRLLKTARGSLEDFFSGVNRLPSGGPRRGSFVTLRKNGELRGCIGYMAAVDDLYPQTYVLARDAAFRDWRFEPLEKDELESVRIEVSVLSPMKVIGSLDDFRLGLDGILVTLSGHRAVFLPEVVSETGWSKEELLSALSAKAGLDRNAWRSSDALFQTFTSEVFREL